MSVNDSTYGNPSMTDQIGCYQSDTQRETGAGTLFSKTFNHTFTGCNVEVFYSQKVFTTVNSAIF